MSYLSSLFKSQKVNDITVEKGEVIYNFNYLEDNQYLINKIL